MGFKLILIKVLIIKYNCSLRETQFIWNIAGPNVTTEESKAESMETDDPVPSSQTAEAEFVKGNSCMYFKLKKI